MSQPTWKLLHDLGDSYENGSHYVYFDETGVYAPEAEICEVIDNGNHGNWPGIVDCPTCEGRGSLDCETCKGSDLTGHVEINDASGDFLRYDACADCDGKGEIDCPKCSGHGSVDGGETAYLIYRYPLEICTRDDNGKVNAWFDSGSSDLESVARCVDYGCTSSDDDDRSAVEILRADLCGEDVLRRAQAYQAIGDYYGFANLDGYPLELTATEAAERYGHGPF